MKIHILLITILFTMIVQNIEASTGCVDVTKAMVLSGKTPYKKL